MTKKKCLCGDVATLNTKDVTYTNKIEEDGMLTTIKSVEDIFGKFYCQECYDKNEVERTIIKSCSNCGRKGYDFPSCADCIRLYTKDYWIEEK